MAFQCQNCEAVLRESEMVPLEDVKDLLERVAPGEVMPSGECKKCGALAHKVPDRDVMKDYQFTITATIVKTAVFRDDARDKLKEELDDICLDHTIED